MTREYPLTGVGAGSYRVLAPDYWRAMANDALPLDNAQNWWRHQIAELGVFGGALVIAFSALVAWRVLAGREVGPDVAAASTARGLLLGLGVVSLFGMPTQNPLVLCWFFGLVAWFATLRSPTPVAARETAGRDARGVDRGLRSGRCVRGRTSAARRGIAERRSARAAGAPRLRHRRLSAGAAAGGQRVPLDRPGRALLLGGEDALHGRSLLGPSSRHRAAAGARDADQPMRRALRRGPHIATRR